MGIEALIEALRRWAEPRADVQAIALVGSHARGLARADSDIDLVLLVDEPMAYLDDRGWLDDFGSVRSCVLEDWGAIQSLRTVYEDGAEVEFGLGRPGWAATAPLDSRTRRVAEDGLVVVFERSGLLAGLLAAVEG